MRPFLTRMLVGPMLALSTTWSPARCQGVLGIDDLTMLPTWCQTYRYVLKEGENPYKADAQTLALQAKIDRSGCKGAWHFCWAMARRNHIISSETSEAHLPFLVGVMAGDLNFLFKGSRPTCALIPEVHVRLGEGYALIGNVKEAEKSFLAALKVKPGYALAYIGMSDMYENQGNTDKAIAVLQQGIKANPGSSGLKKKLARVQARASGESASPTVATESVPAPGRPAAATKPPVPVTPGAGPIR